MINGPILVTQRLILRPPGPEDMDGWAALNGDAETMTHLGGVKSRSESWRDLCGMSGAWHIRGFAMFSLILRDTGQWIGRIGPWQPEGWPGKEIGWAVTREHAGKGYAFEAAIASMDFAFDLLKWEDVIHTINPENTASIKLAERLGSSNLGPTQLPPPHADLRVDKFGQTRAQWNMHRKLLP